jgi:hypothetical protein
MERSLFILILPLLLSGCAHTVGYKLTDSDRWTGTKINGVVCVQPIVDDTLVTNMDWRPHEEHIGKEVWRTNYRGGYSHTNLTAEVTAMIIKHLSYSGLFTKVVPETDTNADYFFSGALVDFQTRDRVNTEAENIQAVSDGFGLIGAIVGSASTSGMKSEIKTSVKLDDLKLADKSGQIVWQDSITISNDTNADFEEASEVIVFSHPDQALKDAVNKMIWRMGNSSLTNQLSPPSH